MRKDEESTLWYRPPEVLVEGVADVLQCGTGDVRSLAGIDMWSVGCLFAEKFIGSPLFESAETSFDLLSLHCDWFGYTYTSPDGYLEVRSPDNVEGKPKLAELVPGLCVHGYDLLAQLLACDYKQRISAEEAESHPFFSCSCELRTCKCCNGIGHCQRAHVVASSEATSVNVEERTPFSDRPLIAANFESYPSFLHSGSSDGSLELPAFIQDLVAKRRLKRQRTLELDDTFVYRDAAPAV